MKIENFTIFDVLNLSMMSSLAGPKVSWGWMALYMLMIDDKCVQFFIIFSCGRQYDP